MVERLSGLPGAPDNGWYGAAQVEWKIFPKRRSIGACADAAKVSERSAAGWRWGFPNSGVWTRCCAM